MNFIVLVLSVVAIGLALANRRRFDLLESRILDLEVRHWPEAVPGPTPDPTPPPTAEPSPEPPLPYPDVGQEYQQVKPGSALDPVDLPRSPSVAVSPPDPTPARKPHLSRDEIMARLPVWLGSLALALSGAFLVKYSFDQGWLGPTARVVTGLGFGVTMAVIGDRMFREVQLVGHGLVAAGVAVIYAALLAGTNLYDLIPAPLGLALLALNTAAAVLLALRHGRIVVVIGMIGGFLTPMWIGAEIDSPGLMFGYLFLLQVGLLAVGNRRNWWPISLATVVAGLMWVVLWMATAVDLDAGRIPAGLYLLATAAVSIRAGWDTRASGWNHGARWIGVLGAGGSLVLSMAMVGATRFDMIEWSFFGILSVGAVVLARKVSEYVWAGGLAAVIGVVLLGMWGVSLEPGELARFVTIAITAGLFFVLSGVVIMREGRRPVAWATLSAGASLGYVVAAVPGLLRVYPDFTWWPLCLGVAIIPFMVAAWIQNDKIRLGKSAGACLAAFTLAVTSLVTLAMAMDLERAFMTAALALQVPVLAALAVRYRIPGLKRVLQVIASVVAVRLLVNPMVLFYPIGDLPVFNWLLYGYGLPLTAFAVTAAILRKEGGGKLSNRLETGAVLFSLTMVTLMVRHAFHPGELLAGKGTFLEAGSYTVAWVLLAILFFELHRRTGRKLFLTSGSILGVFAAGQAVPTLALVWNPLLDRTPVGAMPGLNLLLPFYGFPILAIIALSSWFKRFGLVLQARVGRSVAVFLGFVLVSLEVRQLFHGSTLTGGGAGSGELYSYSVAWILYSLGLLVLARVRGGMVLRYASAIFMGLAVLKVFLYDTAQLQDLFRVLSLLGLGLTLLGLGWFYQKYVFVAENSGEAVQVNGDHGQPEPPTSTSGF
jgi:uncharacterized membrane protein